MLVRLLARPAAAGGCTYICLENPTDCTPPMALPLKGAATPAPESPQMHSGHLTGQTSAAGAGTPHAVQGALWASGRRATADLHRVQDMCMVQALVVRRLHPTRSDAQPILC